jgi:hypothetical protein
MWTAHKAGIGKVREQLAKRGDRRKLVGALGGGAGRLQGAGMVTNYLIGTIELFRKSVSVEPKVRQISLKTAKCGAFCRTCKPSYG